MIIEGVRTLLLAQTTVTALLNTRTNIYTVTAPQHAKLAYIVVDSDDDDHNLTLDGQLADSGALFTADVTVECWDTTPTKAGAIENVIWRYLDDFTGSAGDQTIEAVEFVSRLNDFVDPKDDEDISHFINELRFTIHYRP